MSFIDWLFGSRARKVAPPQVQHLFAAGGVGGVLYGSGRVRSWNLETGEPVHDKQVAGPRVAWDGEQLVDSQTGGFQGLPFIVGGRLLLVGKGELRFGAARPPWSSVSVRAGWLQPSSLLRVALADDGRIALLDPFLKGLALFSEGDSRVAPESEGLVLLDMAGEAPVMDGCFVGAELRLVREGGLERYDRMGNFIASERPHAMQTLAVTPEGSLGLDGEEGLELLVDGRRTELGAAPEKAILQTGRGVLVSLRDGFYVDDHRVELDHQGLLECEEGVLVASHPPALYSRSGRCLRTFEESHERGDAQGSG